MGAMLVMGEWLYGGCEGRGVKGREEGRGLTGFDV